MAFFFMKKIEYLIKFLYQIVNTVKNFKKLNCLYTMKNILYIYYKNYIYYFN